MNNIVDVVISSSRFLCPINENTTVSSLIEYALNEWRQCNPGQFKCSRSLLDSRGRIVPGALRVADLPLHEEFELILDDTAKENPLSMDEILEKYRGFQKFTAHKMLEVASTLHLRGTQQEPEESTMLLINELAIVPCSDVQQSVLEVLNFLLLKFSSRRVLERAAHPARQRSP